MFLTMPEARFPIPQALLANGQSGWSVIRKQMFSPWYIVTFAINADGYELKNTLFVSEPEWLMVVIQNEEIAKIHNVQKMTFDHKKQTWLPQRISEIWIEQSDEDDLQHAEIAVKADNGDFNYAYEMDDEPFELNVVEPNWKMIYRSIAVQGD